MQPTSITVESIQTTYYIHLLCINFAQTQAILNSRLKEELNVTLSISVYDVARNENARTHRKEEEAKRVEEERIRKEKEMDYLAPFLARIGDPPKLTMQQIEEVTQVYFVTLSRAWGTCIRLNFYIIPVYKPSL